MADLKISQLTAISVLTPATDVLPVVDVGGVTKKITTNQILGSGGTATLASATITGNLTVDTSTLKVDSTNNRVGIGTATPTQQLDVSGGRTGLFSGDNFSLALARTSAQNNYFYLGTDASGNLLFSESGGSAVMTLSQSANLTLATGNLVMATSGKGIDFSATANSSGTMTSELLNDYEEGTWVPVIADATTGGNVGTVTINSATYTKIGRQVSIQCDLRSITTTGMTGANNLFIRGLPFASVKGGNGSFYTYRVSRNASTVSSAVTVEHGVSHAFLSLFTTSSANTNLSILVSDITSGTSELALSVTYSV